MCSSDLIELSSRKIVSDSTTRGGGTYKRLVAPTPAQIAKFGIDQIKSPYGSASGVSAESGGKLTLENSSGTPVTSWKSLEVHHPSEGPQEKFRPQPNAQKKNLAKDIVVLQNNKTDVGVPAPMDGEVSSNSFDPAFGFGPNFVELVNGQQKMWIGHMKSRRVKVGDKVKAGAVLGVQGMLGGGSTGPHVHVQGDEGIIKNWVSGLLTGNYTSGVETGSSDDNTETQSQSSSDPFEAMNKSIEALSSGIALLGATSSGAVKDEAGYKSLQEQLKSSLSGSGATESAPSGSAAPSPARPPTTPAAAATAETPKPRTAPTSTAPALHPPTPQPTPTIQKQNMTAAGMSSYSFADIDSSAMKYKPYSMISLVENG